MQLGTRWNVGGEPPSRLPETVVVAVRGVEDELAAESVDASTGRWTLTFLEGQPGGGRDDGPASHRPARGGAAPPPRGPPGPPPPPRHVDPPRRRGACAGDEPGRRG